MFSRTLKILAYVAVIAFVFPIRSGAQEVSEPIETARAQIERLKEALTVDADDIGRLSYETRYTSLEPVIRDVYDLPMMSRLMVGRQAWGDFSADEQESLTNAVAALSTSAYASRFTGLTDQHISVTGAAPGPRDTIVVNTKIEPDQGDSVQVAYVMRAEGDQWRIVDVFINEQYSEVARRRSDFAAVLRDEGLDGLLARIDELVTNYRDTFPAQTDG